MSDFTLTSALMTWKKSLSMWEQDRRLNCGARQQAESQLKKKSTGRKSQEWQTATMKQKGGFGHDNYRKHAPFFGRKNIIFAQTFGFGLYIG